jgi:SAM-dependent methyltransferase
MGKKCYDENFYQSHSQMSISSAEVIIPLVLNYLKPKSVVDVGCGIGTWLSVWIKNGINDIIGIDGNYINKSTLLIDKEKFVEIDLEKGYRSPRKFDIATCLEVAEHIREDSAEELINSLCNMSDFILFSAAIPGQEGTLHVNEQYPSYWAKLFNKNNYVPIDCIRKKIWSNENVASWYRQNIMIYLRNNLLEKYKIFRIEADQTDIRFINLVHPEYFNYKSRKVTNYERILESPSQLSKYLIKSILNLIKRRRNIQKY